jgi:hypothetical protein
MKKSFYKFNKPSTDEEYDPNLYAVAVLNRDRNVAWWMVWNLHERHAIPYISFEKDSDEYEIAEAEVREFEEKDWMWDGRRAESLIPFTKEAMEKFIEAEG